MYSRTSNIKQDTYYGTLPNAKTNVAQAMVQAMVQDTGDTSKQVADHDTVIPLRVLHSTLFASGLTGIGRERDCARRSHPAACVALQTGRQLSPD